RVRIRVDLHNLAPDGPPSILLANGTGDPVGFYAAYVTVYLPNGATDTLLSEAGSSFDQTEQEFGHPLMTTVLGAPSKGSSSLQVSYTLPHAVVRQGDELLFRLRVLPQPALHPDVVSVSVALPPASHAI